MNTKTNTTSATNSVSARFRRRIGPAPLALLPPLLLALMVPVREADGQGTVNFNNRISGGAGVGITLHIWGPSTTNPSLALIGLGSNDNPSGTTPFGSASGMALIGAGGSGGQYGYATTFAQLIAAVGAGQPESALVPVGQTTTFRTGSSLGCLAGIEVTLTNNPGGSIVIPADAPAATFEIVAWDNSSGLYPTWVQASAAWQQGVIAAGHSAPFTVTNIGGLYNIRPNLNNDQGSATGMMSFNLYRGPVPGPPSVATLAATDVTATSVTLNCTVTPNGTPATAWFDWGGPSDYTNSTPTDGSAGYGYAPVHLSASLTGLMPGRTYGFRAKAVNGTGAFGYGGDLNFTTLLAPTVATLPATALTTNSATLNATVNPNGYPTVARFQWGTTTNYGNLTAGTDMGSGTNVLSLSAPVVGLNPGVTCYFRVVATNSPYPAYGADQSFTTVPLPQPTVMTLPATALTITNATLNGTVNPNGFLTAAWFQWGTSTSYGNLTPVTDVGSGAEPVPVSVSLAGLSPGVTYHFRLVATNCPVPVYGSDQFFTTLPLPTVATLPATLISDTTATLNATVNPRRYLTAAWFEWGPTTSYGNLTAATSMGNGSGVLPLSAPLAGLTPGATYHFRVVATNSPYPAYGSDQSFTTAYDSGGVVTNCTEASLRAAIAHSETVTFACDGTITLGSTITSSGDLTLDGTGHQVTISGGDAVRVFCVNTNASLSLVNLTIANGGAVDSGAGVLNEGGTLKATNCTFSRNGAGCSSGGAIYNCTGGTGIVDLCTFTRNRALATSSGSPYGGSSGIGSGGAICNDGTLVVRRSGFSENEVRGAAANWPALIWGCAGVGGAICNQGALQLESSMFQDNAATGGAGCDGLSGQDGEFPTDGGPGGNGGRGAGGALFNSGSATVVNSTFVENSCMGGAGGEGGRGGIGPHWNGQDGPDGPGGEGWGGAVFDAGQLYLTNCTLASNSAIGGGGGGAGGGLSSSGGFMINTLLATNSSGNCSGSVVDGGHNLSSDGTCNFTNVGSLNNTHPMLGPLANNGGPTLTMALLPDSPAVDAADGAAAPTTDQRGFPRPAGLAADIGAFEYGSVMPTLAISLSGSNALNILGSGNANQACRLLSSPDSASWVPIATNQIGSEGTVLFYDTCVPGGCGRFYRLVMP